MHWAESNRRAARNMDEIRELRESYYHAHEARFRSNITEKERREWRDIEERSKRLLEQMGHFV